MYVGEEVGSINNCTFGVMASKEATDNNIYILGNAFLKNYLTVFDLANKEISFGIHVTSKAAVRRTYSAGVRFAIAFSFAVLFPLFVLAIYCLYVMRKKNLKRKQKEARDNERENLMSQLT